LKLDGLISQVGVGLFFTRSLKTALIALGLGLAKRLGRF